MTTHLIALNDGPDIPLDRGPLLVGRHPHCDVRPRSIRVSRRHCCLTELDGVVIVRDLGSTNGTSINGQRVEAGRLRPGDELTIADLRFRLEEGRVAESNRTDPQAASRAEGASLCDLPGPSLDDEGRPGTGPIPPRARALQTAGRAVWRAVRRLGRSASGLRPGSGPTSRRRPASLAAGVMGRGSA